MSDRSKKQDILKRLRQTSSSKARPAATTRRRADSVSGGQHNEQKAVSTARGREGLRARLANRGGADEVGGERRPATQSGGGRVGTRRPEGRAKGGKNAASRGGLAKLLAKRGGKGRKAGVSPQSRTDPDGRLSETQRQRIQAFIRQRQEGGADGGATAAPRQRGQGALPAEPQATLKGRHLGQYDERETETPQARVKRKMMRADLMKEFAEKKRAADKAREEQTKQLTHEASTDMGMLFDESKKPAIGSSPEEIEQYHAQLSIRADWLQATLDEIQAELKMLEQIKAATDEKDLDGMIEGGAAATAGKGDDSAKH